MLLEQFFDPGLGHGSYLVVDPDEGVAFLVLAAVRPIAIVTGDGATVRGGFDSWQHSGLPTEA